jgi:hypothetical protein
MVHKGVWRLNKTKRHSPAPAMYWAISLWPNYYTSWAKNVATFDFNRQTLRAFLQTGHPNACICRNIVSSASPWYSAYFPSSGVLFAYQLWLSSLVHSTWGRRPRWLAKEFLNLKSRKPVYDSDISELRSWRR